MVTTYAGDPLPRFHSGDVAQQEEMIRKLNRMVSLIEARLVRLERPLVEPREPSTGEEVYAVTNVTEDRTFDADATTTGELADVLGTLLTDLINEGRLK
jgi:hypothetical protein